MFVSFFPRPKVFFISAIVWTAIVIASWYLWGAALGDRLGFEGPTEPIVGAGTFIQPDFIWFYIYYAVAVGMFALAWRLIEPHRWSAWSILGSALIIFVTYIQVQVSVAINTWYGPFYDLIQAALSKTRPVALSEYIDGILTFTGIAMLSILVSVFTRFFSSHYVFRWRTAMNEFYVSHWARLRHVEGASQRVQEDTMRFANIVEDLGVSFIEAVMTLIAFLPILAVLSASVTEIPIVGQIPHSLVWASILWSAFGTAFLWLIGIRLPGLEFRNQRVEAAYRKELVIGEDQSDRATPATLAELFSHVRQNYFRLYFNYLYFNVGRYAFLQADILFPYVILGATVVAGVITLGVFQQILNSFDKVRTSFLYLVNSWTTIITLISIYKRLRTFEATLHGEELSRIEATQH